MHNDTDTLDRVLAVVIEQLGDREAAEAWLATPNDLTGGRAPRDLIGTPAGLDKIRAALIPAEFPLPPRRP